MLAEIPALAKEDQARAVLSYSDALATGALLTQLRAFCMAGPEQAFLRGVAEGLTLALELAAGTITPGEFGRKLGAVTQGVQSDA